MVSFGSLLEDFNNWKSPAFNLIHVTEVKDFILLLIRTRPSQKKKHMAAPAAVKLAAVATAISLLALQHRRT